jgi:uncharacterized membrane protein YvlD (DUF360 family)
MRNFVVKVIANMASFYVAQYFVDGFTIAGTWQAYLLTAVVFMIFNVLVAPIIKLLLLPINLITLGLLRWLTNVLVLYIFDILYTGVSITGYHFGGYSSPVIGLPAANLNLFWTLVIASLFMSLTYSLVTSLFQAGE